jgi:hypothetical protein
MNMNVGGANPRLYIILAFIQFKCGSELTVKTVELEKLMF